MGILNEYEEVLIGNKKKISTGYFVFDKLDRKGNYYIYEYDDASGEIPFYPVIYTYDNKFIASVGAEKLLEYKGSIKNGIFQDAIKDLEEDDNPCLLIYELE